MHSQLQLDAAQFGVTQEGIWVETNSMTESIDDGIYQVGEGSATAHVTTLTGRTSLEALSFQQDGQCQIDSLYGSCLLYTSIGLSQRGDSFGSRDEKPKKLAHLNSRINRTMTSRYGSKQMRSSG